MKNNTFVNKIKKIYLYNFIFGLFFTILVSIIIFRLEYNTVTLELKTISNIMKYAIEEIIIYKETSIHIDDVIQTLSHKDDIIFCKYFDNDNNLISSYINTNVGTQYLTMTTKTCIHNKKNEIIGQLVIKTSLNNFIILLMLKIFMFIMIFSVFIMMLAFIIRKIKNNILTPINHIKDNIKYVITTDNIVYDYKDDFYYGYVELKELIDLFNSMIGKLNIKDNIIKKQNNDLKYEIEKKTKKNQELSNLYYDIINSQENCIFRLDLDNKIIFANKKFYNIFCNTQDCENKSFLDQIHPDDRQKFINSIKKVKNYPYYDNLKYRTIINDTITWWNAQHSGLVSGTSINEIQCTIIDITDQKEIEKVIQRERDLFASGPVFIMILKNISESFKITYISQNIKSIIGYDYDELIDTVYFDLIHPEDLKDVENEFYYNLQDDINNFILTYRIKHKHGCYIWVSNVTYVIKNENNEILEIRNYLIDETSKKLTEQNLKVSRSKYESLIESLSDCVYQLDLNFNFVYCSARIKDLLGIEPDELYNTNFKDLFVTVDGTFFDDVSDIFDSTLELIGENRETNELVTFEFDIGHYFIDNIHVGYYGTLRDIGYRKKLEKELMQSSKILLDILDTLPISLIIIDDENNILYKNTVSESLQLPILMNKLNLANIHHQNNVIIKNNDNSVRIETQIMDIWYEIIFKEIVYKMQDAKLIILNNIHNEKMKEINLKDLVDKKTLQLQQTNKELESFAYVVSHDIYSPLRQINGTINILIKSHKDLDDEIIEKLRIIEDRSILLSNLIEGILELSRSTRGEVKKHSFDISQKINNLYNSIIKDYPNIKNHKLYVDNPLNMIADYNMIIAVYYNLIKNAIKFSQDNDFIEIKIGKHGNTYYVSDNGPGIPKEKQKYLFDVFVTLNHKYSGTGVGLTTVKRVIIKHDGKIWLESSNEGTTFYFTLGN